MPPAARVSDPTAHGSPLAGAGSPDVLIGGLPAWRVGIDIHNCPVSDPVTHGPGVVQAGSTTVLINGMPAARMGDVLAERVPNSIADGAESVIIG